MVDAATAIQEQTNRRPFPLRIFKREREIRGLSSIFGAARFGLNRTSHPDWVKMFGDSSGQIKLRTKQKFKFLSATTQINSLLLN